MAAIFYSYSGRDVFHDNFSFRSPINVAFMSSLFNSSNLAIITELGINNVETNQYFLSFDDVINFMHFGKGVGSITVSGVLFSDCSGNLPGAGNFYNLVGKARGDKVVISVGKFTFTGVISAINFQVTSEPDTMAQFQIQLAMIDHSLPRKTRPTFVGGGSTGASFSEGSTSTPGFSGGGSGTVASTTNNISPGASA